MCRRNPIRGGLFVSANAEPRRVSEGGSVFGDSEVRRGVLVESSDKSKREREREKEKDSERERDSLTGNRFGKWLQAKY